MLRRTATLCRVWATKPISASTSSSAYQPQLASSALLKLPSARSAEFRVPTSSITPPTTLTAPARELATASTIIGMFPTTDTMPKIAPTTTPRRTATQLQSIPRATIRPAPIT